MKAKILLILLAFSIEAYSPDLAPILYIEAGEAINPYASLWEAVKMLETDGVNMINEEEQSYGPGQIRQCKLDEYYQATGKRYTLAECMGEDVSREIFMWHCRKWQDIELATKRWNGSGPMADWYWERINARLNYINSLIS